MLTPALKALRKKYPESYIELAIHTDGANDNIFKFINPCSFVNKVSDFRKVTKEKYGWFIDVSEVAEPSWEILGFNLRSRIKYYCELLKVNASEDVPQIELSLEEIAYGKNFLNAFEKVFFIDTSSIDNRRCIAGEVIRGLIYNINSHYKNHCILLSDWRNVSNCSGLKNVINVSTFSLRKIASLIKESDVFFGPDSGLMHLSAAMKTKSIVAFGMVPPEYRIGTYPTHEAVRVESLSCLGCWYKPCHNNLKCMKSLDTYIIYKKIKNIVGG